MCVVAESGSGPGTMRDEGVLELCWWGTCSNFFLCFYTDSSRRLQGTERGLMGTQGDSRGLRGGHMHIPYECKFDGGGMDPAPFLTGMQHFLQLLAKP